jgi:predicted chitinase/peptidoglycan hydrolase-like protein with peptidoglycan-binding domain
MNLTQEQAVFMQHVAELIKKAPDYGLVLTGGELYRTPEQQQIYLKTGRSKTLNSQHLKRLAIDLNFFRRNPDHSLTLVADGPEVRQLGAFWESLAPGLNRWGGNWNNFKDAPHFERWLPGPGAPTVAATAALPARAAAAAPPPSGPASLPSPLPVPGAARGAGLLADTVGPKCQNERADVETVQRLLNLNAQRMNPANPPAALLPDGIIGSKTYQAVAEFQRSVMNQSEPSGLVRPGDACLLALCQALSEPLSQAWLALYWLSASDADIAAISPVLLDTLGKYQINTPLRQAHFLAQIGHESGELRFHTELASGQAYENRRDLGNVEPGDGPRFKGRGLIQLTGRANYTHYTQTSGFKLDFVAHPELIASNMLYCADVAGWFWEQRKLNALADADDLETLTRRVNGGLNGLADRRRLLLRAKTLFGLPQRSGA